jgi:protein-L-isoaspartate O-methyltransferase
MKELEDFIAERCTRLAAETAEVAPQPGFDDWIMTAIEREPPAAWFDWVWRSGRVALVAGALAAAASVAIAAEVQTELDNATLATFELVELGE